MDAHVPQCANRRGVTAENEKSWLAAVLQQHPALLISALYVIASTIGMLFSWDYLRRFGINVFDFAQIGDFLLASLKEPMTWALVAVAGVLVYADNTFSRLWQRKERSRWTRWYGSSRYRVLNYIVAFVIVVIFIDGYARYKARQTFAGHGQIIEYQLVESNTRRSAHLLGTTAQFVFLFDASSRKVHVLPHESVKWISFPAPGE